VSGGETDEVCALIFAGIDVNVRRSDGMSPLHVASQKGYINIVKLLLSEEPFEAKDVNGCTPLWLAAFNGHSDVVKLLLDTGAEENSTTNDNTSNVLSTGSSVRRTH